MQDKKTVQFTTTLKDGVVQKVGRSTVEQPKVNFNNKGIKWFDDSKLYKRRTDK